MKKISSVINICIQEVYKSTNLDQAKIHMNKMLDECNIKEADKIKMRYEIMTIKSLTKMHFYATNAMFKYEGLGVL